MRDLSVAEALQTRLSPTVLPEMSQLKQELSELVEAYAVARSTGNETLIRSSASAVIQFLESVDINRPEPAAPPEE